MPLRTRGFVLNAQFNNISVFDETKIFGHRIARSGISYGAELEQALAAQWAHYQIEDFEQLPLARRMYVLETYRAYMQIQAVLGEDQRMKDQLRQAQLEAQNQQSKFPFYR